MLGWPGVPIHDACTIAYLIQPELFTLKEMNVEIDLDGKDTLAVLSETITMWKEKMRMCW